MSSMRRLSTILILLASTAIALPARSEDGREWDQARERLIAGQRGSMEQAVSRWELLSASNGQLGFTDYAGFIMAWPGMPEEAKFRGWAEAALARGTAEPSRLVAFFDRYPPVTNPARGHYALALMAMQRPEAATVAVEAWRGGPMSDQAEATILATFASRITQADHDERMDALLWAGQSAAAQRQALYVSSAARTDFLARTALIAGQSLEAIGLAPTGAASSDPGFVFNKARQQRQAGNAQGAASTFADRPRLQKVPRDPVRWIGEMLAVARAVGPREAVRVAASADDAFVPGTDISRMSFKLRDDYTSLMWLGGTRALNSLGDYRAAAPLFHRYGLAARTPYTRTKGFYWAGRAMAMAGDRAEAARYFELAAQYPDYFYGQLALERLGRPLPGFAGAPTGAISQAERAAFDAKPITAAVREVARDHRWATTIRFFREICDQAETEAEHQLVADLARELGRRDLAVILGQAAHADGFGNFQKLSFPQMPITPGADWTMVHAITRQESQFAMNAISHAGARGLMQLMPGTAREQAGMLGLAYDQSALMRDAAYNITLGNAYFARMMDYFGGSYPLAVAAYNAGPGNVNKWLRSNGDPRNGSVDWVDWIERIPITETRAYVQRVLENAVVYEAMHPERARYRGQNPLSHFLGKRYPG